MSKFNKFLENNEELITVIHRRKSNWPFYATIFIGLPIIFFFLYPMITQGRQGFGFLIALVIFILVLAINLIVKQKNVYLLTDERIISLKAQGKDNYVWQGKIYLDNINEIKKYKTHSLCLITKTRKFYLTNIKNRDQVYHKIKNYLFD